MFNTCLAIGVDVHSVFFLIVSGYIFAFTCKVVKVLNLDLTDWLIDKAEIQIKRSICF